jgi:hypothetical protein
VITGKCELCFEIRPLLQSHFLPKALYKLMRDGERSNPNPVLISGSVTLQTSYQMLQPPLCAECEDRFSKNGESYAISKLKNQRTFPILDRLKLAHFPLHNSPKLVAFSCPSVGFDGEKIAYYAVSILWRAAVRKWRTFDGGTTSVEVDPGHVESMRRYLLGEAKLPANFVVCATVATDIPSQESCFVPTRIPENPNLTYSLTTKGLAFRFTLDAPPEMKQVCCASSEKQPIFVRDCSDKSLPAWYRLMETSAVKGSLAKSA